MQSTKFFRETSPKDRSRRKASRRPKPSSPTPQEASTLSLSRSCERLVQLVKRALLLNLAAAKLTWDVFATIVTEKDCLVNARALKHLRSDNEDEGSLTSNHSLIGRVVSNIRACVFNDNPSLKMKRWTQITQLLQAIWKGLLREYLPTLSARKILTNPESKLEVNDVVWALEEWTLSGFFH